MPAATLTSKGQVTVPKEIREFLKLKQGQELDFQIAEKGQVILHARNRDVRRLKGMIKVPPGTRATIEDMHEAISRGSARVRR
jgi:antitoxin PrlF